MDEADAKALVRRHGWLSTEQPWLQDAVLSRVRLRSFSPNEFTFHADDDPGGLYGVVSGGFGTLVPSGGQEMILCHIIRLGVWFGHGPVLTGRSRTISFKAVERSMALHLPMAAVAEIREMYPEFTLRLGALSERNYSAVALKVIGDLLMPSLDRRIAATLVRISRPEASGEVLPPWPIHVTQAEIGQMANASRDRVNRALSKFEAKGWIKVEYKVITVRQLDALATYAAEPGN